MDKVTINYRLVKQICTNRPHLYPEIVKEMLSRSVLTPSQVASMTGLTEAHVLNLSLPKGANARTKPQLNRISLFPTPNQLTGEPKYKIFIKNDNRLNDFLNLKNQ
jgi:hypothetical protein